MPIYDYKCPKCGRELLNVLVFSHSAPNPNCFDCSVKMEKKVTMSVPHVFPSDGIHLSNVSCRGKTFYSKNEMIDWEKKTGGYIDAAH